MLEDRLMIFSTLTFGAFLNGCVVSSYGPLIPYYSRETSQDENHFSYIMMARSIGVVLGLLLVKYLPFYLSSFAIVVGTSLVSSAIFITNTLSLSDFNLFATFVVMAASSILFSGTGIGITFQLYPDSAAFYVQLRGFVFGVGAITGPLLVGVFELKTYVYLGLLMLLPVVFFLRYPVPNINTGEATTSQSKPFISSKA